MNACMYKPEADGLIRHRLRTSVNAIQGQKYHHQSLATNVTMLLASLYVYIASACLMSPPNHSFALITPHHPTASPHPFHLSLPFLPIPHHDKKDVAGITVCIHSICLLDVTIKPRFRPNHSRNVIMNPSQDEITQNFRFFPP